MNSPVPLQLELESPASTVFAWAEEPTSCPRMNAIPITHIKQLTFLTCISLLECQPNEHFVIVQFGLILLYSSC